MEFEREGRRVFFFSGLSGFFRVVGYVGDVGLGEGVFWGIDFECRS